MGAIARGPLTIDGVALGQTRSQVERLLGRPTTNANPAWARFYPSDRDRRAGNPPLLVGFRPTWPRDDASQWQVETLCGSLLRQGDSRLIEIGDSVEAVRSLLGCPSEALSPEPGFLCLSRDGCTVVYDESSGRVMEVSLRSHFSPDAHDLSGVVASAADAMAC